MKIKKQMNFKCFQRDYDDGKASGLLHYNLPAYRQADNVRKCIKGVEEDTPWVRSYWIGYYDGMNIAKEEIE